MAPNHKSNLTKARNELEELYSGVPDDSVNLTFQDFVEVRPQNPPTRPPEKNKISTSSSAGEEESPLDFSIGYDVSAQSDHPIHHKNLPPLQNVFMVDDSFYAKSPAPAIKQFNHHGGGGSGGQYGNNRYVIGGQTPTDIQHHHHHMGSPYSNAGFSPVIGGGVYDDVSGRMSGGGGGTGKRRPGIPYSNICTVCSTYIYFFRHRCLVCGRVYCRQCVSIGMGEMTEGRKCIECLGRRFSHRYIQQAGQIGCCAGYSRTVKQQELKWAEKGPRKSGENRYSGTDGGMMSRASRSPHVPSTPGRTPSTTAPSSFVMNSPSPYSPYHTGTHQHLPF